jgi:hypothetical protein
VAVRNRVKRPGIDGDRCLHGRRINFLILTHPGKLVRRKVCLPGALLNFAL